MEVEAAADAVDELLEDLLAGLPSARLARRAVVAIVFILAMSFTMN